MFKVLIIAGLMATSALGRAATIDFESVAGLTALSSNTQGAPLAANNSIVAELPGLVISSLGPSKPITGGVLNGSSFSGVSWLDFSGTGSTAHSGTHVIAGANFDPNDASLRVVDFNNFVEFRVLDTGTRFFQVWVGLLPNSTGRLLFRDDLNGGNTLNSVDVTSSGFVSFSSAATDIRNVVFLPISGGFWLDDLTFAASNGGSGGGGGGTTPAPGTLLLSMIGVAALGAARKRLG